MDFKYSVIIPVYNAEKTICRCLDSLLASNYNSAEIIIINDGSNDDSGAICKNYAAKNDSIIYIEQENAGASAARNVGLEQARGKYITFVDSDDFVSDDYFSKLKQYNDDDFIMFSYTTIRGNDQVTNNYPHDLLFAEANTDRILGVIRNRAAGPVNKRFKKSVIDENHLMFKKDLTIGEDFIFGLEYMLCCKSSSIQNDHLYVVDETGLSSITRSSRYDYSQFLLIYKYAFSIAANSTWEQAEKTKLIQQLDYLFCRTAFASVEHLLKENGNDKYTPSDLVSLFHNDYHNAVKPINLIHFVMRLCIRYKMLPAVKLVAFTHLLMK